MVSDLNESVDFISIDAMPKNFTLKILFGPLFGCEFNLPADDYFIIINAGLPYLDSDQDLLTAQDHSAAYAQKTLYIPCPIHSPNIALHLCEKINTEEHSGYRIEILNPQGGYSTWIEENTLFHHEHICFAFKQSNNEWDNNISGFPLALPEAVPLSSLPSVEPRIRRKNLALIAGLLLVILAVGTSSLSWFLQYREENRVAALDLFLSGSPAPLDTLRAKNNNIYVFGNGFREMRWLHEVLLKRKDSNNIIPIWIPQVIKNVTTTLRNDGYPIVNLDLNNPAFPRLSVYESLDNKQKQQLQNSTLQLLPYAEGIIVTTEDINKILRQAQQGLEGLQIAYRRVKTPHGYALVIQDELTDTTLTSLREFILNFYHRWGEQIVNFTISLDEHRLRDKSYVGSQEGYIFLTPTHWYFPPHRGAT